jgi:hypothetical protein
VAARLVAPRPDVVDPGGARRLDRRLEVGNVLACEAEARHPQLRPDAVRAAVSASSCREAADERAGSSSKFFQYGSVAKTSRPGQRRDRVPVPDPVRALGQRQQADRVLAAARGDVRDHLPQEVDESTPSGTPGSALPQSAELEASGRQQHAHRSLSSTPDVLGHRPVRLVPET